MLSRLSRAGLAFFLTTALGCASISAVRERRESAAGSGFVIRMSQGRPAKVFENWTPAPVASGACKSRKPKLVLYEDGTREWEVDLASTEPRELWEQTFHFYDAEAEDHTWFGSRHGGWFEITYENLWTYWRAARGSPDPRLAQVYDKIGYVVWSARC